MERRFDSRRRFLRVAGLVAVTGVAGCAGGDGSNGGDSGDGSSGSGDGGSGENGGDSGGGSAGGGQGLGPVPDEYATATAQDGTERSPDNVAEKSAVMYQSEPKEGQQCTDCAFYIPDENGDGLGACAVVEGKIEPQAWCSSFVEYEG
ncbi:high-potential iron-sulfur protein [Salinigranum salinum]|uniref:high-potential iron-sulfur protein n=1 Tax=Salinigranum salinum TaxID=1364937 RepID=UPI001260AA66|nr:high-potential iron-sulfur protein [Salinigranum salinum]